MYGGGGGADLFGRVAGPATRGQQEKKKPPAGGEAEDKVFHY
jgi:hypothetical protein